ncbi:MAG: 30S ribosome-binding factor RbfA [Firmicutes bacterium]|nr:30S ribosome-binding factor RbfA [Bacillota bacterium]
MSQQRAQRVSQELKKEISDILRNEVKDPRITGLISVTSVDVTKDLSHAKIFVSVFGSEEEQEATLAALKKATGFVRSLVGSRIRLRHVPELSFQLDHSIAYGAHINQVLREIRQEDDDE